MQRLGGSDGKGGSGWAYLAWRRSGPWMQDWGVQILEALSQGRGAGLRVTLVGRPDAESSRKADFTFTRGWLFEQPSPPSRKELSWGVESWKRGGRSCQGMGGGGA